MALALLAACEEGASPQGEGAARARELGGAGRSCAARVLAHPSPGRYEGSLVLDRTAEHGVYCSWTAELEVAGGAECGVDVELRAYDVTHGASGDSLRPVECRDSEEALSARLVPLLLVEGEEGRGPQRFRIVLEEWHEEPPGWGALFGEIERTARHLTPFSPGDALVNTVVLDAASGALVLEHGALGAAGARGELLQAR